jgi:hypothetical protein
LQGAFTRSSLRLVAPSCTLVLGSHLAIKESNVPRSGEVELAVGRRHALLRSPLRRLRLVRMIPVDAAVVTLAPMLRVGRRPPAGPSVVPVARVDEVVVRAGVDPAYSTAGGTSLRDATVTVAHRPRQGKLENPCWLTTREGERVGSCMLGGQLMDPEQLLLVEIDPDRGRSTIVVDGADAAAWDGQQVRFARTTWNQSGARDVFTLDDDRGGWIARAATVEGRRSERLTVVVTRADLPARERLVAVAAALAVLGPPNPEPSD